MKQRLNTALRNRRELLRKMSESYVFSQKDRLLHGQTQNLDLLRQRLNQAFTENYEQRKNDYQLLKEKIAVLSPLNTLERGYSICLKEGRSLRDSSDVALGDEVDVRLHRGTLCCQVREIKEEKA